MNAYDIHVFADCNGDVRASVTDLTGWRSRSFVLSVGQLIATTHIMKQIKAQHEVDLKKEGHDAPSIVPEDAYQDDQGSLHSNDEGSLR